MLEVTSESDNLAATMRSAGTGASAAGTASACSLALAATLPAGLLLAGLALLLALVEPAGLSSLSTSACPMPLDTQVAKAAGYILKGKKSSDACTHMKQWKH